MAEIVNLRRARKLKARAQDATAAAAKRAKFGRTSAEREAEAKREQARANALDQAKLER